MLNTRMTAITLSALIVSTTLVQAQPSAPIDVGRLAQKISPTPNKAATRNATLTDTASINEDLIGFALAAKTDKVAEKVAAMRKALPALRPLFDISLFETLGRQVTEMEQASSRSDLLGTALAAVEVYRVLENGMDNARRPSPIEVAMLDYSGFKLSILAATQNTDWATVVATAGDSDGSWSALEKRIKDGSIRNLVQAIQDGLKSAVGTQGHSWTEVRCKTAARSGRCS